MATEWVAQERPATELDDLEALMRCYQPRILRFAMSCLRDADAAATVTQDCFYKAYRTRQQFRSECSVAVWLTQIAYNLIRDRTRTRRFQFWKRAEATSLEIDARVEAGGAGLAHPASSPEAQLLARESVRRMHNALGGLPERQRAVFVMRFLEEMDVPEISTATGMTQATVKTHLHRALVRVRARLGATS